MAASDAILFYIYLGPFPLSRTVELCVIGTISRLLLTIDQNRDLTLLFCGFLVFTRFFPMVSAKDQTLAACPTMEGRGDHV